MPVSINGLLIVALKQILTSGISQFRYVKMLLCHFTLCENFHTGSFDFTKSHSRDFHIVFTFFTFSHCCTASKCDMSQTDRFLDKDFDVKMWNCENFHIFHKKKIQGPSVSHFWKSFTISHFFRSERAEIREIRDLEDFHNVNPSQSRGQNPSWLSAIQDFTGEVPRLASSYFTL